MQNDERGAAQRAAIVVFARLPVPGRVKTRLAAGVGPGGACDFYRACAEHAISQAASCADWADIFVYHSTADSTEAVASWLKAAGLDLPCRPQLGEAIATVGSAPGVSAAAADPDLGAKMLAAMAEAQRSVSLKGGMPQGKVLIVGTDIPDITAQLLRRAADALDEHQMVVGPSLDGGYYLLGLTKMEQQLFQGVHWSTDSVLAATLERAAATGLRVAPLTWLPKLRDVDTKQDLAEWVASCNRLQKAYKTSSGDNRALCRHSIDHLGGGAPAPLAGQEGSDEWDLTSGGMCDFTRQDELQRRQLELLRTSEFVLGTSQTTTGTTAAAPGDSLE